MPALLAALKDVQAERAKLKAAMMATCQPNPAPKPPESVERRVQRLLDQAGRGHHKLLRLLST
jgi:hypothetical protein